jgi:hypothetical protein
MLIALQLLLDDVKGDVELLAQGYGHADSSIGRRRSLCL